MTFDGQSHIDIEPRVLLQCSRSRIPASSRHLGSWHNKNTCGSSCNREIRNYHYLQFLGLLPDFVSFVSSAAASPIVNRSLPLVPQDSPAIRDLPTSTWYSSLLVGFFSSGFGSFWYWQRINFRTFHFSTFQQDCAPADSGTMQSGVFDAAATETD